MIKPRTSGLLSLLPLWHAVCRKKKCYTTLLRVLFESYCHHMGLKMFARNYHQTII